MAKVYRGNLTPVDGRFAIVVSRFNEFIGSKLLAGALDCLDRHGVADGNVEVAWVPGSFEIPLVARRLAASGRYVAVICLGAIIRGETDHYEFVAAEAAKGVAQASLQTGVPVVFGVLTTDTLEQAINRAGAKTGNKGADSALAAIEMADLMASLPTDPAS